jgi:hypothetical protein
MFAHKLMPEQVNWICSGSSAYLDLPQQSLQALPEPHGMESVLVTVVAGKMRHLLGALDSLICLVDHALHGLLNLTGGLVELPFPL